MEHGSLMRKLLLKPDALQLWAIAILLVIAVLFTVAAAGSNVLPGDVAVAKSIQAIQIPGISHVVEFTNWAGTGAPIAVLMVGLALGLGMFSRFDLAVFVAMTIVARSFNTLLKAITESPRPTDNLIRVSEYAQGQGFPSGHVMSTTLFYGVILYMAQTRIEARPVRWVIQALALIMILATGFGRIQVGAHWPSDVAGAYLWSIIILFGVIRLHQYVYGPGMSGARSLRPQRMWPAPSTIRTLDERQ
jgi:undecaprenyl-diphosphatase